MSLPGEPDGRIMSLPGEPDGRMIALLGKPGGSECECYPIAKSLFKLSIGVTRRKQRPAPNPHLRILNGPANGFAICPAIIRLKRFNLTYI